MRRDETNLLTELRTPLTLILGPLEDVLASGIDVRARALLEVVQRNATRLHHLVNTLLDFARLEAGRYLGHIVPVQFGQLTENFASLFRSAIERGGVEYVVDCAEEGPSVYLDPDSCVILTVRYHPIDLAPQMGKDCENPS